MEQDTISKLTLPNDPALIAHAFLDTLKRSLRFWRDDFIGWNGRHYEAINDKVMEATLAQFMNDAVNKEGTKFVTSTKIVKEVLHQVAWAPGIMLPPTREDRTDPRGNPITLIPCRNGALDINTDEVYPHSPDNLIFNTLQFDYNPNTEQEPTEFLKFVHSLWPDDDGSEGGEIACLQEMIGYLLSGDGSLQKIFVFVGKKRSGKGTIAKVINALVGDENCVGVNTKSFKDQFGMASMIGKPVCIMPDVRNHTRGMTGALTEQFLTISGQDKVAIDRKYKSQWVGILPTRIVVISNVIPHIPDTSGVIASRFVPLAFDVSFANREDTTLFSNKLLPEMPQILNWAIEGLKRLRARGHFIITARAKEMLRKIEIAAAPHLDFLGDNIIVDPDGVCVKETAYDKYVIWADTHGHRACAYNQFLNHVEEHYGKLETVQSRKDNRKRGWKGIRLADYADRTPPCAADKFANERRKGDAAEFADDYDAKPEYDDHPLRR